jgi:hypothetical protein
MHGLFGLFDSHYYRVFNFYEYKAVRKQLIDKALILTWLGFSRNKFIDLTLPH